MLPGITNEYRLGTLFMRNFYTALDFDNDMIILGVNSGQADNAKSEIFGHADNPYNIPSPNPG